MRMFDRFLKHASLRVKLCTPEDDWIYDEEPHKSRRKVILNQHPEIKELMCNDPKIAYIVAAQVIAQLVMCNWVKDCSWTMIVLYAYCIGAVLNTSLAVALHECGHNLAFRHPVWNRVLSLLANIPLVLPMAISYKIYHHEHHIYLGDEDRDVDVPTRLEARLFRHWTMRIVWLLLHPIFVVARPLYKSRQPILTPWVVVNIALQLLTNFIIVRLFGSKAIVYLLAGILLGTGLHPLNGHYITEHYVFSSTGQATSSYYGPLNFIMLNAGYHIEHHDFPNIPFTRLAQVRKMAPEFYNYPYHTSWVLALWRFVFDDKLGPQARSVGHYLKPKYDHTT